LDRLISTGLEPLTVELLEQYLGQPNSEKIWNLIEKIGGSDATGTLAAIEDLICTGVGEVQVVDSLIDYMRDLMVVKSAGPKSELIILTGQQRQRAGEIAGKFDIAALIYNIATLEKLRWAVKNSDTSRALLEASLLRFALSEHFMNVEGLLSELKSGTGPAVSLATSKKKIAPVTEIPTLDKLPTATEKPRATNLKSQNIFGQTDIQSIKDNWPNILKAITTRLGGATAGLLGWAEPSRFEDGILTLEFNPSAQLQKGMCERNGRIEQIQDLLCEQLSIPVKLKLEIAAEEKTQAEPIPIRDMTIGQRRNELINDPAVKTVLLGLDATITDIEED
jgi:DNA polymerase-3 subunit gamma/tau